MNNFDNRNEHLNLFQFYGDNDQQYYENNLTRGLALCLENDPVFLDRFLKDVTQDEHEHLKIQEGLIIDVQKKSSQIENVSQLFGIAMTAEDLPEDYDINPRNTEDPITDLTIQVSDSIIVIEVKRNKVECRNQLNNQLERIAENNEIEVGSYETIDYSWEKVMKLIRSTIRFQENISLPNRFTKDYYQFIKRKHPSWLGPIKLNKLRFPKGDSTYDSDLELFDIRLNFLKQKILESWNKEQGHNQELVYNRANIPITNYNWAEEINIEPHQEVDGSNYIALKIWPGDTKTQGYSIFKNDIPFDWPSEIEGFNFKVTPYIKFSHMQGLCWVRFNKNSNPKTHTKTFFNKFTGKWKRQEDINSWQKKNAKWTEFDEILESVHEGKDNWKVSSGWENKIQNTNRSFFYVSTGFAISVLVDYNEAQKLDAESTKSSYPLADKLKEVSEKLLGVLDEVFQS